MTEILKKLESVLESRKKDAPDTSYVASLYNKGSDEILKKIGEETAEVIIAAKGTDNTALVHEIADLWFHSMVLLASMDIKSELVLQELERRFGESGLKEKANRAK